MRTAWEEFVGSLRRVPEDASFGEPADYYIHSESGAVYENKGEIGKGRYGSVYAYHVADDSRPAMAVKCIRKGASFEIYAVHSMSAITATRPKARGFIQAALLRESGDAADVAMPMCNGNISKFSGVCNYRFASDVAHSVATTVRAMWTCGVAYCDIKTTNVLYVQKDGIMCVVLGDLGSIVPRRAHDGSFRDGIFTFPPQRALDGIVVPVEGDLVWGIGTLIMTMLLGTDWVASRLTGDALRERFHGNLEDAFDASSADIRGRAEEMRASGNARGARVADALDISVDAWNGSRKASLAALCRALRTV